MDDSLVEDVGSLFSHKTMEIYALEAERLDYKRTNRTLAPLFPHPEHLRNYADSNNIPGARRNMVKNRL